MYPLLRNLLAKGMIMRKLCFSLAILLLPLVYDAAWIPNARSQTEINVEFILHVDNERGIDFRQLKLFIQSTLKT